MWWPYWSLFVEIWDHQILHQYHWCSSLLQFHWKHNHGFIINKLTYQATLVSEKKLILFHRLVVQSWCCLLLLMGSRSVFRRTSRLSNIFSLSTHWVSNKRLLLSTGRMQQNHLFRKNDLTKSRPKSATISRKLNITVDYRLCSYLRLARWQSSQDLRVGNHLMLSFHLINPSTSLFGCHYNMSTKVAALKQCPQGE